MSICTDKKLAQVQTLEKKALEVRKKTFEMVVKGGKGHLGGSFSCIELLVALYHGKILRIDSSNPSYVDRDRFILSKAHACNSLYIVLNDLGFFGNEHIENYLSDGGMLGEHPHHTTPGVEISGGSLGHGIPQSLRPLYEFSF